VLVVGVGGDARRISDVNRAAEEMFGYDREELVGETTDKLHVDRESFVRFGRVGGEALEEAGVYRTTFPLKRRDGTIFEAEQTVTLLDAERGIDGGAVSVIRDVSEQREAEARLRESRDRFETLFRANPAGIVVTRMDDGTIADVNDAYLRIVGYDREEVLGRSTTELGIVDPEYRMSSVRDLVEADVGQTDQYVLRRKDGGEAVVLASAEEITLWGEPHLLVMAQDITEYRSLERQLREAQKMEAVGRLAGGIAHDFNNLLTVIRSQADLVLMDLGVSNPVAEDMQLIRESADRAARLTRQLLAFSREQVLEPRVVDLNEMLRSMGDLLERTLGEQVRIRTDFEEGLNPIRVDPAQLEQVVVNLAVNARDAMPEGGTLTLSTDTEAWPVGDGDSSTGEDGEESRVVKLEVSDTGVGMDQETMARIFEPFFTTKRDSGGTGLGLATSYGIVRQSGGTIEVNSEPGSGSTFVLRFPAAAGPVEWPEEELSKTREPGMVDARVLVVEDDPSVRAVTTKILERAGIRVRTAEDIAGARELMEDAAEELDLLLTDLVLPGGSGRELVELARKEAPHMKVLVMSGYTEESPGSRGDLPPDVGFIQKPFTPETLLAHLQEMLSEDDPRSRGSGVLEPEKPEPRES
ncbi:MAG: PAS domain S-box protein, partial [Thermoanaerobaculia bacterium]|nr:PAS domain S-box protein [Thermoanaerobaculia bacterium]